MCISVLSVFACVFDVCVWMGQDLCDWGLGSECMREVWGMMM